MKNNKKRNNMKSKKRNTVKNNANELNLIDLDNTVELGNFMDSIADDSEDNIYADNSKNTIEAVEYLEDSEYLEDEYADAGISENSDLENVTEYEESEYEESEYEESEYEESEYEDVEYAESEYEDGEYAESEYSESEYEEAECEDREYIENEYEESEYEEIKYHESEYDETLEGLDEAYLDDYEEEKEVLDFTQNIEMEYGTFESDGNSEDDPEDEYYAVESYDDLEDDYDEDQEEEEFVKKVSEAKKQKKQNKKDSNSFWKNLSASDYVMGTVIITLIIVVLLLVVTAGKSNSVSESENLYALGQSYASLSVPGKDGIFKMTQYAIDHYYNEPEEEMSETPSENTVSNEKSAEVKFTSVEKDLKIKIIDKSTSKPISGVEFEATLKDSQGTETVLKDTDKDGVIYQTGLEGGTYTVTIATAPDITFDKNEYVAEVKGKIEYEKIDIADEIKTENEVNAAAEDTAVNNVVVEEPTIQDTVEWVESTRTASDGSDGYTPISKDDIVSPDYSGRNEINFENEKLSSGALKRGIYSKVSILNKKDNEDANNGKDSDNNDEQKNKNENKDENKDVTVTSIDLEAFSKSLEIGETYKIKATANFSDGSSVKSKNSDKISFSSENNSIADVDSKGVVTAKSLGEVTINVKCQDVIVGCLITVIEHKEENKDDKKDEQKQDNKDDKKDDKNTDKKDDKNKADESIPEEYDELESVVLSKTETSLAVDTTETLEAKAMAKNNYIISVEGKNFTWSSSDESVAKVGSKGKIKALKEGTAVITASFTYKEVTKKCECNVTVVAKPENDTTSPLKTKDGKKIFVKDEEGKYREATYADYYTATEFFVESNVDYKYTGWQTIDGNVYFYDKNGNKVTGDQVIQGVKYSFNEDGILATDKNGIKGIDVSSWNSSIDWTAVKNSGISFVIIRCGYRGSSTGALVEDSRFRGNITGAKAAGLKVGLYFFTQAVNEVEAVEEASMAVELAKNYGIGYPIFVDTEPSGGRADGISKADRTAAVRAFCQTVQNSGFKAGVYASKAWYGSNLDYSQLSGYKIWLAQYASEPTFSNRYDLWQYSSTGSVGGIKGKVDMNISYLGY